VISLYPNFQRTYEFLLVNPSSPTGKKNDLPPDSYENEPANPASVSANLGVVEDDYIPATIDGKLASWYLDKLQSDFRSVTNKAGEMQLNLSNESCIADEDVWTDIQKQRRWLNASGTRLQELLNEVMEEPAIMQVIFQLSEFINSLEQWVLCYEDDRLFEGKQDYDTKEIYSLITLIQPDAVNANPAGIDLSAPDVKVEDPQLPDFKGPMSPATPTEDLTAEFDFMNIPAKREPKLNLSQTPFNSITQLQATGSEPMMMDNDIFSGLDKLAKPKRDPESRPAELPPLTPASSMIVEDTSRSKNVASAVPEKILLMSKTPNNSVRNSDSPQIYSPSETLPSDMLFPDLLVASNNAEDDPSSKPATILPPSKTEPISIIPAKTEPTSIIPAKKEPFSIIPAPIVSQANEPEPAKMPEPAPVKDASVSIPSSAPVINAEEEDSGP